MLWKKKGKVRHPADKRIKVQLGTRASARCLYLASLSGRTPEELCDLGLGLLEVSTRDIEMMRGVERAAKDAVVVRSKKGAVLPQSSVGASVKSLMEKIEGAR